MYQHNKKKPLFLLKKMLHIIMKDDALFLFPAIFYTSFFWMKYFNEGCANRAAIKIDVFNVNLIKLAQKEHIMQTKLSAWTQNIFFRECLIMYSYFSCNYFPLRLHAYSHRILWADQPPSMSVKSSESHLNSVMFSSTFCLYQYI